MCCVHSCKIKASLNIVHLNYFRKQHFSEFEQRRNIEGEMNLQTLYRRMRRARITLDVPSAHAMQ